MMLWLLGLQTVVILLLLLVWHLYQRRTVRQQLQHQQQLSQQLEQTSQRLVQLQAELEELRSGIIGVGQRVLQVDNQLSELAVQQTELNEKQQALELTDPESKIYSRAVKMVELGADLEEIIRECELPRAEAELLFSLHKNKS